MTKQAESVMGIGGTSIKREVSQMKSTMITAVGIDISKNKSTVAVRRPGGEIIIRPFEVRHTSSDLKRLTAKLKQLGGDILLCVSCKCYADPRFQRQLNSQIENRSG